MLVARFSDNIQEDIERGWSAWMTPGLGGSYEDCLADYDAEQFGCLAGGKVDIREFPEFPGSFGCFHHLGLSCYELEATTIEDALIELKGSGNHGDGYGSYTIGNTTLLKTIPAKEWGSFRDLHILEVDSASVEADW